MKLIVENYIKLQNGNPYHLKMQRWLSIKLWKVLFEVQEKFKGDGPQKFNL
jgi:hypothetical protein